MPDTPAAIRSRNALREEVDQFDTVDCTGLQQFLKVTFRVPMLERVRPARSTYEIAL